MYMKSLTTTVPSVKEAVSQGMNVCLPNILDEYLHFANQGIASDAVITHLSYEVATENDISATQAEDVIYYTLTKLGALDTDEYTTADKLADNYRAFGEC